ncbi:MAG: hypothetical protein FJ304_11580 [Planctomycetes bacterium]|nr:hypothetical protein [Planctomycetota bacterium]
MSRSLSRLAVVLAGFAALVVALTVAPGPRPVSPPATPMAKAGAEVAPLPLARPEVAPEPSAPRWRASGPALPGLPADAEALTWEPAAPALQPPILAGFSPDGRFLATVHIASRWETEPSGLYIWDIETGTRLRVPTKDPGQPYWMNVGFAPDNTALAVRFGGHLSIWDATAAKPKAELSTGDWRESFRQPVFAPDGGAVALGGSDLLVFDAGTRKARPFGTPALPKGTSYSAPVWSPNGRWLAAVTESASHVCVWDADSGEVAWKSPELPHGYGTAVAFTADSKRVIAVNWRAGALSEWDIATKKRVRDAKVPAVNGDLAADGSRLAWLDAAGAPAVVIADADGKELRRIPLPGTVQAFRLSGNGKRLAVRGWDGSLRVYDAGTGALVRTVSDGWSPALHVAYRANGAVVRSVHADGTIREQDAATGQPLRLTRIDLPNGEHFVTASTDGRLWATVTTDGAVRVWDVATGRPRADFAERVWVPHRRIEYGRFGPPPGAPWTEPDYRATALTFAAGGRYLIAATGEGKTITVWDVTTGRAAHTIATTDRLTAFALSPDGATVFAACASTNAVPETVPTAHTVRAWDVASGKPIWELWVQPARAADQLPGWMTIRSLQLLRDGDTLAVVATEFTTNVIPGQGPAEAHRVWVVPRRAGAPTRSYLVHEPRAVAFSADGRWLVSGTTRACDLVTGARFGSVHAHAYSDARYNAVSAAFHPHGKFVALATPEWAAPFDVEAFRKRAEQQRNEQRAAGHDPPDDD